MYCYRPGWAADGRDRRRAPAGRGEGRSRGRVRRDRWQRKMSHPPDRTSTPL